MNEKIVAYRTMFQSYPDVVSVGELQKMLGIGRHLAYELINNKRIYAFKIGRCYKIPKLNVIRWFIDNDENAVPLLNMHLILLHICSCLLPQTDDFQLTAAAIRRILNRKPVCRRVQSVFFFENQKVRIKYEVKY